MKHQYNLQKNPEQNKTQVFVKSWQQSLPTSSIVIPQSFLFSVPKDFFPRYGVAIDLYQSALKRHLI